MENSSSISVLSALARPRIFNKIFAAQQEDPAITREVIRWRTLQAVNDLTPEDAAFVNRHRLTKKGFWWLDAENNKWRLRVPVELQNRVIWEYHDAALAGHPGIDETIRAIQELFFWPGMNRKIRRYVSGCHLCICSKLVPGRQPENQRRRPAK